MEKNVLVVATVERASASMRALEELGFNASFFEFRTGLAYKSRFVRGLIRRIPGLRFIKKNTTDNINRRLLEEVERFKPNYLIATVAENIYPETILKIRSKGVICAYWFTDLFTHWRIIERIAPAYTIFFSSDSAILEKLKELNFNNCFYLPEAVDLNSKNPAFENRKSLYDTVFIGSYDPNVWQHRERFLKAIKGSGLKVWGPETWKKTSLKDNYQGQARGEQMFDIYRAAKIALEIPWDDKVSQAVGSRPFEVMSAGSCLFMYDVRKDMTKTFIPNKEYVPFLNEKELKEKIDFYLKNEERRENIARAAYKTIVSNHTYKKRMEQIIQAAHSFLGLRR